MSYLPERDFHVYYMKLPISIRGVVTPNEDDTYSIFLNSLYPHSVHEKTFEHEVEHIEREDFYNGLPIELVENL